jgi:hypothetical protein
MKVDGFIDGGSYSSYWNIIQNRFYMDAPLEITLGGAYDTDTHNGTLDISITATDIAYWEQLHVRIALTESELYFPAPNGAAWHEQTMRDMIPNANGLSLEIDYGETVEMSQSFNVPAPLVAENCDLVVWVQSDYLREVYQAAVVNVTDLEAVDVEDETADLPESFSLLQNYPNPFNASTTISYQLDDQSSVALAIYDLSGRKVNQLVNEIQPAGNHQVIWDGQDMDGQVVSTGVYFYRLEAEGQTSTKRMVLLK